MLRREGATGPADLLRALVETDRDALTLDHDREGWYGYRRLEALESLHSEVVGGDAEADVLALPPVPAAACRTPLKVDRIYCVTSRQLLQPDSHGSTVPRVAPMTLDDPRLEVPAGRTSPPLDDLVARARLLPQLRRWFAEPSPRGCDVDALVARCARLEPVTARSQPTQTRWHRRLVLLLDLSESMWPYLWDMTRLARWLTAEVGAHQLSVQVLDEGPFGPRRLWSQQRRGDGRPVEAPAWLPGTKVLVVTHALSTRRADAETMGDAPEQGGNEAVHAWPEFLAELERHEVESLVLTPTAADDVDPQLARQVPVLRWSADAGPHPVRAGDRPADETLPERPGLADLLAMVAATRRTDPPLLRAFRRLLPTGAADAGLEAAVWAHPDVEAGGACQVRAAALGRHLQRFAALPLAVQQQVHALCQAHHARLPVMLQHEETLLCHAAGSAALRESLVPQAAAATEFFAALTQSLDDAQFEPWAEAAHQLLSRLDPAVLEIPDVWHALGTRLYANRPDWPVPHWLPPPDTAAPESGEPMLYALAHDLTSGHLLLAPSLSALWSGWRWLQAPGDNLAGHAVDIRRVSSPMRRRVRLQGQVIDLGPVDALGTMEFRTATEQLTTGWVRRPLGAAGWGWSRNGLFVVLPPLGDALAADEARTLHAENLIMAAANTPVGWTPEDFIVHAPPRSEHEQPMAAGNAAVKAAWDLDALGACLDLTITSTEHRTSQGLPRIATQRLRYIPPGTFLMGSPVTELQRNDDYEGPQHPVTISQGFWLADTTCTQALWLAVMGGQNPSHFKGDTTKIPVDSVSWDDAQAFLTRLQALLPAGCEAVLPTEAQWEYACRAGTTTPFSFGEQISPDQVNYYGNHPYAGAAKGAYRKRTVPVTSLPPNPWGLYEMHGNLWEWCADAMRTYIGQSELDPRGGTQGADRVLRGGSWIGPAQDCRSAYRSHYRRDGRIQGNGFRFVLRSTSPGGGAGWRAPEGLGAKKRRRLSTSMTASWGGKRQE